MQSRGWRDIFIASQMVLQIAEPHYLVLWFSVFQPVTWKQYEQSPSLISGSSGRSRRSMHRSTLNLTEKVQTVKSFQSSLHGRLIWERLTGKFMEKWSGPEDAWLHTALSCLVGMGGGGGGVRGEERREYAEDSLFSCTYHSTRAIPRSGGGVGGGGEGVGVGW